ncbi:MAG: IS3 family transposase, partial [Lachnospiraceae bacterium]|nr:IS3 family transposase [Lachnospiraceae bacterium]
RCTTYEELCTEINDYMDYYNNERYQWELAKLSPNQYAEYLRTGYYPIEV